MVVGAYAGLSGTLLLSIVAFLLMLGMPAPALVPLVVQIAAVLLGAAIVVEILVSPFRKPDPRAERRAALKRIARTTPLEWPAARAEGTAANATLPRVGAVALATAKPKVPIKALTVARPQSRAA